MSAIRLLSAYFIFWLVKMHPAILRRPKAHSALDWAMRVRLENGDYGDLK